MSTPDDGAEQRSLLRSIVELAAAVFGARACSIMSHDPSAGELVFEAVAGEGADTLVGRRLPATTGLAGWALASEEPIAVADVRRDPRFAREVAESTGYVPSAITVFPLLARERAIGVLSLLDQSASAGVGLAEMSVLATLAAHAAAILQLVLDERARPADEADDAIAALQRTIDRAGESERRALLTLIESVTSLAQPS